MIADDIFSCFQYMILLETVQPDCLPSFTIIAQSRQLDNMILFNLTVKYSQEGSDAMDTLGRLRQLLKERNWTEYRLAKESGLSDSTIKNIYKRNTQPTIDTLEAICRGFGITLAQFFSEGEMVELTPELKELFDNWLTLTQEQKQATLTMIKAFNHDQ